jgi:hypothetical protein
LWTDFQFTLLSFVWEYSLKIWQFNNLHHISLLVTKWHSWWVGNDTFHHDANNGLILRIITAHMLSKLELDLLEYGKSLFWMENYWLCTESNVHVSKNQRHCHWLIDKHNWWHWLTPRQSMMSLNWWHWLICRSGNCWFSETSAVLKVAVFETSQYT